MYLGGIYLLMVFVALIFSGASFFYASEIKKENDKLKVRIEKLEEAIN